MLWFGTDETSGIKCLALVAQKIGTLSVAMTMQQIIASSPSNLLAFTVIQYVDF